MEVVIVTALSLAAALALFLWLAWRWRGPEDSAFVASLRVINTLVTRWVHRLEAAGPSGDPLPIEGPCIVVANHRSGADPLLVSGVTRRWVHFLMAREYYETTGATWLFRGLGCIPVNRTGKDLAATRSAMKALRAGRVVGIFPQGGIRDPNEDLAGVKGGVALLALRTGVPIIPFYIDGSPLSDSVFGAMFIPSRSKVYFGKPIEPPVELDRRGRQGIETLTAQVIASFEDLRKAAASNDRVTAGEARSPATRLEPQKEPDRAEG